MPPTSDPVHPHLEAVRRPARTVWHWVRYLLGLGLAALAVYVMTGRTDELSGASDYLTHLDWGFVLAAVFAEVISVLAFAGLQRRLLWAGELATGMRPITGITLAGTAIQNSLPGGVVVSAVYSFRQYRKKGADDLLAAWVLIAVTGLSDIALVFLAAIGLAMAASAGSAFNLVEVIVGLLCLAALVVVAWAKREWLIERAATPLRLVQRVVRRPRGDAQQLVDRAVERLSAISPDRRDWAWAAFFAMTNWVADLSCLGFAFWALGAGVPWRGLLLAYTAGQLAANLPITPGGLGVVEGSLTIALVAFGGGKVSTVAAVLLYRMISFWAAVPIGWLAWGLVALGNRSTAAGPAPALQPVPVPVERPVSWPSAGQPNTPSSP